MNADKLSSFITRVEELTNKPEKYLSIQNEVAETVKIFTRDLYNFMKQNENPKMGMTNTLKELVIENLDEEQIWQQVELQNNEIRNSLLSDVAHLLAKKDNLKFPIKKKKKHIEKLSTASENEKNNEEKLNNIKVNKKKKANKKRNHESSVVDDKFFKLHEMESFLEKVERGEEEEDDDYDIDYFDDEPSDTDSDKQFHYNDFFDQPDEGDEGDEDEGSELDGNCEEDNKAKRVKFMLNESENEDSDDDDDDNDNDDEVEKEENEEDSEEDLNSEDEEKFKNNITGSINLDEEQEDEESEDENEVNDIVTQPSTFEARQERLKTRIQNLEEEALREKPWQLKGEVTATSRPQNSLLEEYVEFDTATRPAPVFTETTTLKLEDVIIQRIKDKAWDDVIRKIKPVESDMEYKKEIVLDQEKSKLSLAQIYEQEYLKQLGNKTEGADKPELEPPEHQEIRIMMNKLFSKLDALSNFHFTPKQITPEVKIVSNLPAISMEEVAPVAMSDAALLAPEEVKPKSKGELIGKSERTKTDKKRERRQKKLKQKIKYKQMEAKAKLQLEQSKSKEPQKKKISEKFLQKITKSSNITQLEQSEGSKYLKSSNAFFSKLQNENGLFNKGVTGRKVKLDKNVSSKKKSKTR